MTNFSIIDRLIEEHKTKRCVNRYHRHKEWILFVCLISIIVFLVSWSGWVNHKISVLENHTEYHVRFDREILQAQIVILEKLEANDPEKRDRAIKNLIELNKEIENHLQKDYR